MYRILLSCFFVLLVLAGITAGSGNSAGSNLLKKPILRTVVIDPGHGGHDSGCHGSSAYEKHIALAVSLKLGKLIEANFPDVKVIFTRKTDVFVELFRRAQIANENKADLFICIHCNSGPKTAYGAETFVMGLHKTNDNLNVAKRENAVILKEDNYERKYDGFDPNSAEANIIFSLYQNAFLTQSLYFADRLQHEFKHYAKRNNRGVKQAGFLVLYRTTMPAVLIETGFLTNHEEEKYLKSSDGQQEMANSILKAFNDYKNWVDGTPDIRTLEFPESPKEKQPEQKPIDSAPLTNRKTEETIEIRKPELKQNETASLNQILFRVQIFQSDERMRLSNSQFKGRTDVWEYRWNNSWKYTVGSYNLLEDAVKLQAEMKRAGFSDAFVVAFRNNERITLQEAQAAQP
jgi:N-acetylmuramoyl-L-alanine amidase